MCRIGRRTTTNVGDASKGKGEKRKKRGGGDVVFELGYQINSFPCFFAEGFSLSK